MTRKIIVLCLICTLTLLAGVALAKQPGPAGALLKLGESIYNDKNLSINNNQSCKSCHHPRAGFVDMSNTKNPSINVVSTGSIPTETGGLNAPTSAYAFGSPSIYWDGELFVGGIFWNGRATGHKAFNVGCLVPGYEDPIFSPLAEQAQGPFLNSVEMGLPDAAEVVARVAASDYAALFYLAFDPVDFTNVDLTYDQIAVAIAYFETSTAMNPMSSKWDLSVALTTEEAAGMALFMSEDNNNDGTGGGAMCVLCHVADGGPGAAMFTDFSYDNLGLPANPLLADKPIDPGLGSLIQNVLDNPGAYPPSLVAELSAGDGALANWGKHKVSTLRNVHLTPPFGHNGYFPSLTAIVQFYNTRDPLSCSNMPGGIPVTPSLLNAGIIPGYNGTAGYCWPAPEIVSNVNVAELGNLGLTSAEVDAIVAFLGTLAD